MTYRVLDTVVLARDLPEYGLRTGEVGAVVAIHDADTLELEFVSASGRTDDDLIAVRRQQRS